MEEALERSYECASPSEGFKPLKGYEDIGLTGKVEVIPHPQYASCLLVRSQVKWGGFPFSKTLTLEYLKSRNRP